MSPRKLLLLCGLAAILVFMIIYFILSSVFSDKKEPQPQAAAVVPVIEASRDIEPQTVITEDMVKAVDVSSNLVPSLTRMRWLVKKQVPPFWQGM